jgi:hypothetical protein
VAETREPERVVYDYGQFKNAPGTSAVPGVRDTFFGPRDKAFADFHARDMTRIRGTNLWYYVLDDQNRRVDGDRPLSDAEHRRDITTPEDTDVDPFQRKAHAGFALYGERVKMVKRLDSVRRQVEPDWPYLDPILVRGLVFEVDHENEPDERGVIYVRRATLELARVLCEREWKFQPRPGDIVRFEKLLDQYMDVEDVHRAEDKRFGGDGFFVVYKLTLVKSSKYEPQRKIAVRKQTVDGEAPPNEPVDPNPGKLS